MKGESGLNERLEALKTAVEEANPLPRPIGIGDLQWKMILKHSFYWNKIGK